MSRVYGRATKAQKLFTQSLEGLDGCHDSPSFTTHMDARSNLLREFYVKAQKLYRGANINRGAILNEVQQTLVGPELEGFMMGWQAEEAARERGLQPSQIGTDRIVMDEESYHESFTSTQGRDVLAE